MVHDILSCIQKAASSLCLTACSNFCAGSPRFIAGATFWLSLHAVYLTSLVKNQDPSTDYFRLGVVACFATLVGLPVAAFVKIQSTAHKKKAWIKVSNAHLFGTARASDILKDPELVEPFYNAIVGGSKLEHYIGKPLAGLLCVAVTSMWLAQFDEISRMLERIREARTGILESQYPSGGVAWVGVETTCISINVMILTPLVLYCCGEYFVMTVATKPARPSPTRGQFFLVKALAVAVFLHPSLGSMLLGTQFRDGSWRSLPPLIIRDDLQYDELALLHRNLPSLQHGVRQRFMTILAVMLLKHLKGLTNYAGYDFAIMRGQTWLKEQGIAPGDSAWVIDRSQNARGEA